MAATVNWPSILVPADAKLSFVPSNTSGGLAFDASEQVVGNTPGRAKLSLKNIHLSSPAQIGAWLATERAVGGRAGTIDMPVYEKTRAPWPINPYTGRAITTIAALTLFAKTYPGASLLAGVNFAGWTDVIQAFTTLDTPVGATSTTIQIKFGAVLQGYETFGFNEKVYGIFAITGTGSSGGFPTYTVSFALPCRQDIPATSQLAFDNPILRCKLESDDAMDIKDGFKLHRLASPGLTLWEDV